MRHENCICAWLPKIRTRTHVHIIRHSSEIRRPTNTGRIAHLALENSSLVDHGLPHVRYDPSAVIGPDVWLLFPPEASAAEPPAAPPPPSVPERAPRVLVVPDGNWGQARRMTKRIPALRDLPRLTSSGPRSGASRLRKAHAPWAMSTIEAIARALSLLAEPQAAEALDAVFDEFVRRTRKQRGEPPEGWVRSAVRPRQR